MFDDECCVVFFFFCRKKKKYLGGFDFWFEILFFVGIRDRIDYYVLCWVFVVNLLVYVIDVV